MLESQETLAVCSSRQKQLLTQHRAYSAGATQLPSWSMRWQIPSTATSFDRLAYTWQAVASHHPVLRTSFRLLEGSFELTIRDRASPIQIKPSVEALFFDGEPTTANLAVCVDDSLIHLSLRVFSFLVDRPSLALIRHDFELFYNGMACDPHSPFQSYINAVEQRDQQKSRAFWRSQMIGTVTSLTYGIPRGIHGTHHTYTRTLEHDLVQNINTFCDLHNVPIRHFFHAAWAMIQYRHTAAADNVVVFAVSGRDRTVPEAASCVGLAEELYPLKLQISGDLSALDWIMEVAKVDQESATHAFLGYDQIAAEISPLSVQVHLLLGDGLNIKEEAPTSPRFPLSMKFDSDAGLLEMTYSSDSDESDSLMVLTNHLAAAMEQVVSDPQTLVGNISVISKSEQAFLAAEGGPLTKSAPGLGHKLVERQVELSPNKEAVNFEGEQTWTYAELNRISNQVARQLPTKRGDNVSVCMDRSHLLIIALLAIMKTGATYVILSPDSPAERNDYIIRDVSASFVLADQSSSSKIAGSQSIEQLIGSAPRFDGSNLHVRQEPDDLVYIIYTSGLTGKPKGVMLTHAAATTGLQAFPNLPGLRQLLSNNPVFSAAQRSIWATLKQGGTLCLARKERLTTEMAIMVQKMRVSSMDVTPSLASLMEPESVPSLQRMTLGGELVNPALLPIWTDRLELLNAYGLSEVTQINWRQRLLPGQNHQIIGRPMDSTCSYVLLPGSLQQAALLEPGELALGGHQLAAGYLNQPERTAEAFMQNPFGPGRLYRTGDMVVRHPDGSIELLGRIDFQIKINGQRVEPGETNFHLQEHADVSDARTVAATVAGKKTLVAVVIPKNPSAWPSLARELQRMLRQQLPSYMVPAYWLSLSELPLNITGKVDIKRLTQLAESTPKDEMLLRAPRRPTSAKLLLTSVEETMRTIWAETLNLSESEISLDDSFLGLGGSSLEAIKVVSSARAKLIDVKAQEVRLKDNLAEVVKASKPMTMPLESTAVKPFALVNPDTKLDRTNVEDAWPVSPSQEPMVADLVLGGTHYSYTRILRLWKSSIEAFKRAFTALIKKNPFLRSIFTVSGRTYLQLIYKQIDMPWEVLPLSLKEYQASYVPHQFALGEPMFRVTQLQSQELVIHIHHALFDYWSSRFMFDDISALISNRQPLKRPSYAQFSSFTARNDASKAGAFWKSYLQEAQPTILQMSKQKDPEEVTMSGSPALQPLAQAIGIPVGSLLYAAWAIVLFLELGQEDLTIGAAFSGRDVPVPDIIHMYGPTVTNAPIRLRLSEASTLEEVSKAVQIEVLHVSEHAYVGLRAILRAAGQGSSLFNTAVNSLFRPDSAAEAEFEFLQGNTPPLADYIKIEADTQRQGSLSITSSLEHAVATKLLSRLVEILTVFEEHRHTAIRDISWEPSLPVASKGSAMRAIPQDPSSLEVSHDSTMSRPSPVFEPSLMPESDQSSIIFTDQSPSPVCEPSRFPLAHSQFEYRAMTHANKAALVGDNGEELTYAQLNARANQLASFLRARGVQLETVVPLFLDKSINTLVSMFGIWKAGCAFCALDPTGSVDRNRLILEETQAPFLITDKANESNVAAYSVEKLVLDDDDLDHLEASNHPLVELTPESLAYILYTSGSTGKPKGVMITHGSVSAAAQGMIDGLGFTDEWRALWALNYIFDGSYFDVFPTLSVGGTLCVTRQQTMFADLAGHINRFQATHLNVTPTIAKTIAPSDVPCLRVLLLGGEPLNPGILDPWAKHITVYNNYGPTEGTVMVSTTLVKPTSALNNIGKALPSADLFVVKADSEKSVPMGELGELCIRGPHVARGYLNRPAANEAAFFRDSSNRVVYRTGDLVRLFSDGHIEISGRKDDQVKINGFRIELGEIETAIQNSRATEGAVVLAATVHQKKQLVACVKLPSAGSSYVGGSQLSLLEPSCLEQLKDLPSRLGSLAHYMMPTVWLPLSEFPLLPSGKIDRKILLVHVEQIDSDKVTKFQEAMMDDDLVGQYTSATNEKERVLLQAWATVLEKPAEEISTSAAFYNLGGDSIAAINISSDCRKRGYTLTVGDVLAYPSVREQAQRMSPMKTEPIHQPLAERTFGFEDRVYAELRAAGVEKDAVEAVLPCMPGQAEFLTQGRTKQQSWQLLTVRSVPAGFDLMLWKELVRKLTAKNQILRAIYFNVSDQPEHPKWAQAFLKEPVLDMDTIFYQTEEDKQQIIDSLWNSAFTAGKPAVQYRILTSIVDGSLDIYLKLDHASYDGTLLRIFDEQFKAMAKGLPPPEPIEFTKAIQHYVNDDNEKTLEFWTSLLQDAPAPWPLVSYQPKPDRAILRKTGPESHAAAQRLGVTPPILFQTAWGLLLGALSQNLDVVYDNLLTGRDLAVADPQRLNGNCANFLPFRPRMAPAARLRQLVQGTQSALWETTAHGLVGLGDVYRALERPRAAHAARTMFIFQPFDPPAAADAADPTTHQRWIVMAMSRNRMAYNYAYMCEVGRTAAGYKVVFQHDARVMGEDRAARAADAFLEIVNYLCTCGEEDTVQDLMAAVKGLLSTE